MRPFRPVSGNAILPSNRSAAMLRRLLVLGVVVGTASLARSDDPKVIVEKGLKACGWDKGTSPCMTWKEKGKFTGGGHEIAYTGDWSVQLPDKYRFAVKLNFNGQDLEIKVVTNGDKAYESAFDMSQEVTGEKLTYTKNQVYTMWVQSLSPLLTDAAFKLAAVDGPDEAGKPVVGMKVTREGKPPVNLFFDKASGLLVRSDVKTLNEFEGWKECTDESHLSDWKDIGGGVKAFHKFKTLRDGKTLLESDMTDFKRPEKLDSKLFEKP
jgi:hypothetical protein